MSENELRPNGGHYQVSSWSNVSKGLSPNIKNIGFIEVQEIGVENDVCSLGKWNLKASHSCAFPGHSFGAISENHRVTSVDSGIPTLEIADPEPVHCNSNQNVKPNCADERVFQSSKSIPLCGDSSSRSCEHDHVARKSSTFPRSGYDTAKLYSPTSLNRSDDISDCSISSLSTEFSTTLSVSNEDIVDFLVTSNSSSIVTLENDEAQFSDVTLNSTKDHNINRVHNIYKTYISKFGTNERIEQRRRVLRRWRKGIEQNIFARKKSVQLEKQSDLGWKLFGKFPHRDQNNPSITQKEYEERIGRASKSPPSPKQNVRKSLVFEPLSTTALILEDRPANLPAKSAEEAQKHRQDMKRWWLNY
ncbi:TBC1 domain family member 14 isoform X2 [Pelobates cultripes]|uniref:TBC1 domain family member 14 isoform X2 n=1 Tax=Pelobates cultripes TaxID=61616 RepID=A0AAD1SJ46_PELCU|nr:TBC1 domain family member 14 isoform X2 [Pelobates cultripes]